MLVDAREYAHVRQCIVHMSHTPQELKHFTIEAKMDEKVIRIQKQKQKQGKKGKNVWKETKTATTVE